MQSEATYEDVIENLEIHKQIALGNPKCGPIAQLDIPERFRWLTATRSSILQASPSHPGKTDDLDATFNRLFEELVK